MGTSGARLPSLLRFSTETVFVRDDEGKPRISNNALAAIMLMVAMSDPNEKHLMVALITRMLSGSDL
jgi:hypothetical protein